MSMPVAAPASPVHPLDHYHEDRALPFEHERSLDPATRAKQAASHHERCSTPAQPLGEPLVGTLAYLAVLTLAPTLALRILG